jgi:hypothetical protein
MNTTSSIQQHISKLITPKETAEILGIKQGTLNVWRCKKRYDLNFVKIGKRVMYRLQDVIDFIEKRSSLC